MYIKSENTLSLSLDTNNILFDNFSGVEDIEKLNTIVLSGDNWHHGVIGIVASKLTEKFYKPTILICFEDK